MHLYAFICIYLHCVHPKGRYPHAAKCIDCYRFNGSFSSVFLRISFRLILKDFFPNHILEKFLPYLIGTQEFMSINYCENKKSKYVFKWSQGHFLLYSVFTRSYFHVLGLSGNPLFFLYWILLVKKCRIFKRIVHLSKSERIRLHFAVLR